ncbi:MAG: XrtA/PEP-CTERM system TPR-repeat protein PrsT [Thiobacillaceae bacterium]
MAINAHRRSRRKRSRLDRSRLLLIAAVVAGLGLTGGAYHLLSRKSPEDHVDAAHSHIDRGDRQAAIIELKNALQMAPENAQVRYELGKLYLADQDYASAEKELKRARDGGLRTDDLPTLLARALIGLRQPKRVLDEIPVPEGAGPELATHLLALRARAQLMLGDRPTAEQSLGEADQLRPDHPETLLTRAQIAVMDKQLDTALGLIDRAIAADGKRVDLWLMKGDLLRLSAHSPDRTDNDLAPAAEATGRGAKGSERREQALAAYRKVLELDPGNVPGHIAVSLLHLETNDLERAEAELKEVAKLAPDHPMMHYLSASIDFRRDRANEAKAKLQQALKRAPDLLPAHLLAGAVELKLGNRETAIAHLGKVLERIPEHAYARKLMAAAMAGGGQLDEAQRLLAGLRGDHDLLTASLQGDIALRRRDYAAARQHLEQASALAPDNPALLIELARSRMGSGDTAGAIEALNRAAELDTSTGRPDAILVQTHLRAGRHGEAMAAAERLIRERPQDPLGYHLAGIVRQATRDIAGARASFADALQRDAAYLPAAVALARLDLQADDPKAAQGRFESVLAKDPRNSRALIALAGLAATRKDEKAQMDYLNRAKQANPKDPAAYELLALYWMERREPAKAIVEAKAGLDASGHVRLYDAMGTAQLMQNDRHGALASFQQWVKAAPADPRGHYKLALIQRMMGETEAALQSLDRALAIAPNAVDAQSAKAVALAEAGRPEEGLRLARSLQQKVPKSAVGFVAEADILAHGKNLAAAGEAYAKAARIGGNGVLASTAYRTLVKAGQQKQADALLIQWLAERPGDDIARHTLADGLLKSGKLSEAMKHYAQLYKANPKDVVAANNLAWIYGELRDPRAVPQAEEAYALAPEHPSTLDTLGWILVNSGQVPRGLRLLEKAHQGAPDRPDIHWHLALALSKSGETRRALAELEILLGKGMDFPQRQEAVRTFNDLKNRAS